MNRYFAACSSIPLEDACRAFEREFDLPSFELDSHDHWRYGVSERSGIWLNVTKARDFRTIETWIPGCPEGANYQLILRASEELKEFQARVAAVLGAAVAEYANSPDRDDMPSDT